MIDRSQSQEEVLSILGFDDINRTALWPFGDDKSFEISILRDRWEDPMIYSYNGGTSFAFLFNNKKYYSSVLGFEKKPSITLKNNDLNFLFIFNPDGSIAQYSPIRINKIKNVKGSAVFFISAMGLAKEIQDAILLSIDYMDEGLINKNPHGNVPLFKTTLLFRFRENNSGSLEISQDDSCLGNPNNYKTIAQARQALRRAKCN